MNIENEKPRLKALGKMLEESEGFKKMKEKGLV